MSMILINGAVSTTRFPDDDGIYGVDFAGRLAAGDSIVSATATPLQAGITATSATYSGTIVQARVFGAASGTSLAVAFECRTAQGDTWERPVWFQTL